MIHFKSCEHQVTDKPWLEPITEDFRDIHTNALFPGENCSPFVSILESKDQKPMSYTACCNTQHICNMQQPLRCKRLTWPELSVMILPENKTERGGANLAWMTNSHDNATDDNVEYEQWRSDFCRQEWSLWEPKASAQHNLQFTLALLTHKSGSSPCSSLLHSQGKCHISCPSILKKKMSFLAGFRKSVQYELYSESSTAFRKGLRTPKCLCGRQGAGWVQPPCSVAGIIHTGQQHLMENDRRDNSLLDVTWIKNKWYTVRCLWMEIYS